MHLLVHGVTAATIPDAVVAASGGDVELIVHEDLAAVVRPAPDGEVLPSRANLLAHTSVLEALAAETTVLPMRFGMVVEGEQQLVDGFLAPQQAQLVAALEQLRGHVELRLRGRYDEDEVLREVVAADPALGRLRGRRSMDAKMALGERVVAGIEARRETDLDRVVEALGPHVSGIVAGSVAEPLDAFSLSLLVPQATMDDFDAAVDELGQAVAPALALELVGPVPPFSFTAPQEVPA
ncbi:MAG: GvpL/GvpF family gas vesicle protein [Nitriliruptor sp.]